MSDDGKIAIVSHDKQNGEPNDTVRDKVFNAENIGTSLQNYLKYYLPVDMQSSSFNVISLSNNGQNFIIQLFDKSETPFKPLNVIKVYRPRDDLWKI